MKDLLGGLVALSFLCSVQSVSAGESAGKVDFPDSLAAKTEACTKVMPAELRRRVRDDHLGGWIKCGTVPHSKPTLRWFAVSWSGPPGGDFYVADTSGAAISKVELGQARSVHDGPMVGGFPTLLVDETPGSGTGLEISEVAIVQIHGAHVQLLWQHEIYRSETLGDDGDEVRYVWAFANKAREIVINGVRKSGKWSEDFERIIGKEYRLRAEHYCFIESASKYLAC